MWRTGSAREIAVAATAVVFGIGYTIYSEHLNTAKNAWAYSDLTPTLPGLGAGLAPLAQWAVVPVLAFMGVFARLHALERPPARLGSDEGDTRMEGSPENTATHPT